MTKRTLAIVSAALLAACSAHAPIPIQNGEVCFRCRRVIVDKRLAAQAIGGGLVSNYRTSGCIAKYIAAHPEDQRTVYVTDYVTGKMVRPETAYFLETMNRDNGERDYIAYAKRSDVDAAAFAKRARWVRWDTVMVRAPSW